MFKESAQILSTFEESANDHINKFVWIQHSWRQCKSASFFRISSWTFHLNPAYASKEVAVIFLSLTNADLGDIFETIFRLKTNQISVSAKYV